MPTSLRATLLPLVLLAFGSAPTLATTIAPVDAGVLIDQSRIIFVGTAVHEEAALTGDRAFPFTLVTFKVEDLLKGSAANRELTIALPGGPIDGEQIEIEGAPRLAVGERYLLFLSGNGASSFPIVGWSQGQMRFARDSRSGAEILVDSQDRQVVRLTDHRWILSTPGGLEDQPDGRVEVLRSSPGVDISEPAVQSAEPATSAGQALAQLRAQIRRRATEKTFAAGGQVPSARASDLPFSMVSTPSQLNVSSPR